MTTSFLDPRTLHRSLWSIALLTGLALAGCTLASEPVPAGPIETGPLPGEVIEASVPPALPRVSEGRLIFLERCASCHGAEGAGDGEFAAQLASQGATLPDFTDRAFVQTRSPAEWFQIITTGTIQSGGLMPPWSGTLNDQERWNVAYYLYTLSRDEALLAGGETLFADRCAECHGPDGQAPIFEDYTRLAGLNLNAIMNQALAGGVDGSHPVFDDLGPDEAVALAYYVQSLGYDATLPEVAVEQEPTPAETEEPQESGDSGQENSDATPEPTQDPGDEIIGELTGTVSGQVVTPGGEPFGADMEVRLRGVIQDFNGDIADFLEATTRTDAEGNYSFEDMPFDEMSAAYIVTVVYNGVEFSNGAMINPTQPQMDLPIIVYETTSDPSVITVDTMHVILREHPDALLVVQVWVFSNTSDKVFVTEQPISGGRRGSVAVHIPPNAENLTFEEGAIGERFIPVGDLIYDTAVMFPGQQTQAIIATYFLPLADGRDVTLPITYNTASVNLLVAEGSSITSRVLERAGSEVIEDQAFTRFTGQSFQPGDTLTFRVRPQIIGRTTLAILLGGVLVAGVVGGAAYWLISRRMWAGEAAPLVTGLNPEQEALARQIADLDEAFEAGQINRFEYEARRAELKAALAGLLEGGE